MKSIMAIDYTMLNLLKAKKNLYLSIHDIASSAPFKIKRRLLELGFTPGTRVRVLRKSLLGQAYLIEIRGFTLSMRREILAHIIVD